MFGNFPDSNRVHTKMTLLFCVLKGAENLPARGRKTEKKHYCGLIDHYLTELWALGLRIFMKIFVFRTFF
jgi:hypothetical protein